MPCFQNKETGHSLRGEDKMKKTGQIYEITDADITEVSFVEQGANRRSFYLVKSLKGGNGMKSFEKAFEALFDAKPAEEICKVMESLDDETRKARTDALTKLAEIADDLEEDVLKALEILIVNVPVIKEKVESKTSTDLPENVTKAISDVASSVAKLTKAVGADVDSDDSSNDSADDTIQTTKNKDGEALVEVDLDELQKNADKSALELVESFSE